MEMERENYSQLELFSQTETGTEAKKTKLTTSFLRYIRSYEKIILLIIGFIVTGIIAFSIGVEKGKESIPFSNDSRMDLSSAKTTVEEKNGREENGQKENIILSPAESPSPKNIKPQGTDNLKTKYTYTIQVASYQTKSRAQKEIESFKKRGFTTSMVAKGKYNVIYVGKFPNKKSAQSLLTELRKQYKDCFIRRL